MRPSILISPSSAELAKDSAHGFAAAADQISHFLVGELGFNFDSLILGDDVQSLLGVRHKYGRSV